MERGLPIYRMSFNDILCLKEEEASFFDVSLLKQVEEFIFPVSEDGTITSLVTVGKVGDEWQVARTLNTLRRDHGRISHVIAVPNVYQYFMAVEPADRGGAIYYVPAHRDPMSPELLGSAPGEGAEAQGWSDLHFVMFIREIAEEFGGCARLDNLISGDRDSGKEDCPCPAG